MGNMVSDVMVRALVPNLGFPVSKSLGCSKFDSVFHPSEVNEMRIKRVIGDPGDLVVKSKL